MGSVGKNAACGDGVALYLLLQQGQVVELLFVAQFRDKFHAEPAAVEVLGKIEQVDFEQGAGCRVYRWPVAQAGHRVALRVASTMHAYREDAA